MLLSSLGHIHFALKNIRLAQMTLRNRGLYLHSKADTLNDDATEHP